VALCGQSPSFNTDCRFSVVTSFEEKKTLWISVANLPLLIEIVDSWLLLLFGEKENSVALLTNLPV
jgi:hypothetical protein